MAQTQTTVDTGVVFKGRMMTLTVIEIRHTDCSAIAAAIEAQVARAPEFFKRLPVLLSLPTVLPDLGRIVEIMNAADLLAVGVLDASEEAAEAAHRAGLGLIDSPGRRAGDDPPERAPAPRAARARPQPEQAPPGVEPEPSAHTPSRLVTRPVRSGQQIYARGGDLVIAAAVSEGAEVLADGHIHIYGPLRGRALAGASGDSEARIYCRRFEPELVAIAGCYQVAEAMDEQMRSRPVQVRLEHDNLLIELQE